jgi:hypothetical protein
MMMMLHSCYDNTHYNYTIDGKMDIMMIINARQQLQLKEREREQLIAPEYSVGRPGNKVAPPT